MAERYTAEKLRQMAARLEAQPYMALVEAQADPGLPEALRQAADLVERPQFTEDELGFILHAVHRAPAFSKPFRQLQESILAKLALASSRPSPTEPRG